MERTGVWHLANFFTFGNALAGVAAIFFAAKGDINIALRLVALGMLLDSFDGPIARWRGPTEEGKTLDRVSDRITMALAPAVIFTVWSSFDIASMAAGMGIVFVSLVRLVRTDAAGIDMVGFPFWAPGVLILGGVIAQVPFWVLCGLVFFATVASLSKIPFSFPYAIRKPNPAQGRKNQWGLAFLRSAPFAMLVFLPGAGFTIMGWGVLIGCAALLVLGTLYMIWKNVSIKNAPT